MITSFWKRFDDLPPILVRLLARKSHSRELTTVEIAERSGLTPYQVTAIGLSLNWDGIDVQTAHRFCVACNVDFCNSKQMHQTMQYLKKTKPTWQHLRFSPEWVTLYEPLMIRYMNHMKARHKR